VRLKDSRGQLDESRGRGVRDGRAVDRVAERDHAGGGLALCEVVPARTVGPDLLVHAEAERRQKIGREEGAVAPPGAGLRDAHEKVHGYTDELAALRTGRAREDDVVGLENNEAPALGVRTVGLTPEIVRGGGVRDEPVTGIERPVGERVVDRAARRGARPVVSPRARTGGVRDADRTVALGTEHRPARDGLRGRGGSGGEDEEHVFHGVLSRRRWGIVSPKGLRHMTMC
jgi:hypothetical protein